MSQLLPQIGELLQHLGGGFEVNGQGRVCLLYTSGALIAMGLSYWQDDKRTILLWQVVANLIFAIHYTLLHACLLYTSRCV